MYGLLNGLKKSPTKKRQTNASPRAGVCCIFSKKKDIISWTQTSAENADFLLFYQRKSAFICVRQKNFDLYRYCFAF
ncbi:MAG: hypothetical protein DCC59_00475 [Chloroflexi bacterium]|nr:MAG: hypothetical protein DCC59_00475 [Chloroflexota bacterium]